MLNFQTLVSSVTEIGLGVVFVTLNGPFHFFDCYMYTRIWSPELIWNFVAG